MRDNHLFMRDSDKRRRARRDEGDQDVGRETQQPASAAATQGTPSPETPKANYEVDIQGKIIGPYVPEKPDVEMNVLQRELASKAAALDCMIGEIFSPPRVGPHAVKAGMNLGFSSDQTTVDPSTGENGIYRTQNSRRGF